MKARLIFCDPAPGTWNMAVDETLLRSAARRDELTLRIYQWSEPTLSLGYFQRAADRTKHPASQRCPVVRRPTGGGAILHDREWTYSLTLPIRDRTDRQIQHWYHLLHQTWIATLDESGVPARLCERTDASRQGEFLCFLRRAAGDLLLGDAKIGGSAQRRHHQAVLQHGSLLIDQSPNAPELPGVLQLASARGTQNRHAGNENPQTTLDAVPDSLKTPEAPPHEAAGTLDPTWLARWTQVLATELNVSWRTTVISDQEHEVAEQLQLEKYGCDTWTLRR